MFGVKMCNNDKIENERVATQISVSLSQTIMTASLVMLTIIGGIYAALSPKLIMTTGHFWITVILLILSMALFILSIFLGGMSISGLRVACFITMNVIQQTSKGIYQPNKKTVYIDLGMKG